MMTLRIRLSLRLTIASLISVASCPNVTLAQTGSLRPPLANVREQTASDDAPLFSRHVVAVFSKLGCNGGMCHGAVKGQNGFRLALFGADPALDYERIIHEFGGRRLNRQDPGASLLLLKATGKVSHEGGKRMDVGSLEYT